MHPVPLTTLTLEALKDSGLARKDAERAKNMFALGLLSWMYHRPTEGTESLPAQEVRQEAGDRRGERHGVPGGLELRRDHRGLRGLLRGRAGRRRRSRPGTYRNISGNLALAYGLIAAVGAQRAAAVPGLVPDHPGLGHPARAEPGTRTSACGPSRPRTRSPAIGAALGASFGGSLAVTTTSGPGVALKSETIGLAVTPGAAAAGRRHPARRPLDRPADQDRAGRPAPGDVRAQRRGAGADRRAGHARRTASPRRWRRPGSRSPTAPRCSCSPTATWPTAPSRGGSRSRTNSRTCGSSSPPRRTTPTTDGTRGLLAVPARPGDAGPPLGGARHPGSGAPHRRHREAGRHRATSPTTRPTTTSWSAPGRPRSTGSPSPTWTWTTRTAPPAAPRRWCWAGVRPTGRSPPRSAGCGARAARSRRRTCATSTPSRPTSARCSRAYERVLVPEMNLGQLAHLLRAKYLVDARSYNQVTRAAVQGRTARAGRS